MKVELVRVEPIALMPTQAGCAVFLGNGHKVVVFYIDPAIGASINMALSGEQAERPMTHDLMLQTLEAFGGKVTRVLIVRVEGEVFFARLFIEASNEIMERKIVELDARPSDCLALAARNGAPIYFLKHIWDAQPDMTEVLQKMRGE